MFRRVRLPLSRLLLALAAGISALVPARTTYAVACSAGAVTIIDNVSPLGGVFTYYEDTGTGQRGWYVGYSVKNNAATTSGDLWVKLDTFAGGGLRIGLASNEDGIVHLGPLAAGATKQVYFYLYDAAGSGSTAALNETFQVNLYPGDPALTSETCDYTDTINAVEDDIAAAANKVNTSVAGPNPPGLGGIMTMTVVGATGTIGATQVFALTPAVDAAWPANSLQLTDVHVDFWSGTVCPDSSGGVPGSVPATFDDKLVFVTPVGTNSCYRVVYTFVAIGMTAAPTLVKPVNHINSGGTNMKHTGLYEQTILPIQPASNTTTLTKSASPTVLPTGGVVTYTVTITNTGTAAVSLDEFKDTLPTGATYVTNSSAYNGSAIANPIIVGQVLTWTGIFAVPAASSRTLTYQANIPNTAGSYINSAFGLIGSTQIDTTVITTDNQPATTTVLVGTPALSVVKTASPQTYTMAGQVIGYSYLVTNSGNVTLSGPFTVSDDKATNESCPATVSLAPGNSITCTASYTITQADLNAGSVTNIASASNGTVTSQTDTETVTAVQSPALTIDKTASPLTYNAVGNVISYSYLLTNSGNVTLSGPFSVSDDKATNESCPATASLAPGASTTCTASHTITQADLDAGSVTNVASATNGTVISPTDTATVAAVQSPALTLSKSASPTTYTAANDVINYTFIVTNTGNVTLTGPFTVNDDKAINENCPATPTLAPGASITCTASYSITAADITNGSVTNVASATNGTVTSPTDTETVTGPMQAPSLTLSKNASPTTYDAVNDVITYTYIVTNNGNTTLSGPFTVSDDKATNESCPATASLAPGASITCTASHTISQADLDAGSVTNVASASNGTVTSPTDSETVTAVQSRALSVVKTANPMTYDTVGQVISYSYLVTNSGNVTLSGPFTVSDDKATDESCPPTASLAPGASITCTASYTITQGDLDAGSVTNVALATNGTVTSPDSETVIAALLPALTIVKAATPLTYAAVGDVISYSYMVTNTGNTTLSGPFTVNDDKATDETCPATVSLAPMQSITCTATYTIAPADVGAHSVTNLASATNGTVTSPTDTETVTLASCLIDTDGDGIADCDDPRPSNFDPSGFIYDEVDGRIVPGGLVNISGPGPVVLLNGSTGQYAFQITASGTYTLGVIAPPGYGFSQTCLRQDPPPFNPPVPLPNVLSLGNPENGSTGFLTSNACTTFYLSFDLVLVPGDPVIINNNIPLRRLPTPTPVSGPRPPTSVPVLPPWALAVGALFLAGAAAMMAARRSRPTR